MGVVLATLRGKVDEVLYGVSPWGVVWRTSALIGTLAWGPSLFFQIGELSRWVNHYGPNHATRSVLLKVICWWSPNRREDMKEGFEKSKATIQKDVLKSTANEQACTKLPVKGQDQAELLKKLSIWSEKERLRWGEGQASGTVYHGGPSLNSFLSSAYGMFSLSNPLHPDMFPYVRKMEAELVQMCIHLFQGNDQCCGTMTSGGTESILLACKAYRDRGFEQWGITKPEIVAPITIHAAFEKAAHYFGMRLVHVDVDPITMTITVDDVKRHVTRNTVLIAASAPCFPHGIIDPIAELSEFARSRNIGFHSDCCLGGLLLPFVQKLYQQKSLPQHCEPLPRYDFSAPGVSSISADLHKYGYAPKGTSVVMYHSEELCHYQYFVSVRWTGGIYASPTLAGSRPGGLSAAAWAAMMHLGEEGYIQAAEVIMQASTLFQGGIAKIKGLKVLGRPQLSVVSFTSEIEEIDIYKVSQGMSNRGWSLSALQYPPSLHLCCTYLHTSERVEKMLHDLKEVVDDVQQHPEKFSEGVAAIYGAAQAMPDTSFTEPVVRWWVDALFMP